MMYVDECCKGWPIMTLTNRNWPFLALCKKDAAENAERKVNGRRQGNRCPNCCRTSDFQRGALMELPGAMAVDCVLAGC